MFFGANGEAGYNGEIISIMESFKSPAYVVGTRAIGILLDRMNGSLSMTLDSKFDTPAFGYGSDHFSLKAIEEQTFLIFNTFNQRDILKSKNLKLFVSLLAQKAEDKYSESPLIKMNFGASEFSLVAKGSLVVPLDEMLKSVIPTLPPQIILRSLEPMESTPTFTAFLKAPVVKSFSIFPPTAHRKSLCASIIQRAWKRHHGKAVRRRLRLLYISAAIIIQTAFRKKLSVIMAIKHAAARMIQRNWRRKMYIHAALFKAIYKKPLKNLHRAAITIQTEWRRHYLFKTSPFAVRYGQSLDSNHSIKIYSQKSFMRLQTS